MEYNPDKNECYSCSKASTYLNRFRCPPLGLVYNQNKKDYDLSMVEGCKKEDDIGKCYECDSASFYVKNGICCKFGFFYANYACEFEGNIENCKVYDDN